MFLSNTFNVVVVVVVAVVVVVVVPTFYAKNYLKIK